MKRTSLITRILQISAAAAGLHATIDFINSPGLIVLVDLAIAGWLLLLVILNSRGNVNFVRWAALLSLSLMLLALGSFIPKENGLHLLFLPLLGSSFLFFDYDQHRAKFIASSFIIACYLLLELSDFRLFGVVNMLEEQYRASFIVNFLTASVLIYLILSFITKANAKAEQQLKEMAEEVQQHNESLSRANEELDRFVYSTSHDLRAPLMSLSGLLQLIENAPPTESITPYLSMMQGRIKKLSDFIDDITLYARNTRTPIQLVPIGLYPFIQEVLESHRYLHQESKIELRQLSDPHAIVISDTHRLLTIINNLVSNAIKYHRPGLSDQYVAVGAVVEQDQLHLWVEDNGPGIDPAVQARMFEMFFRGDERSGGSGLGLFIVKEAVAKLQGTIEVESTVGKGTTFHIWLPSLRSAEPAVQDA